MNFDEFAAQFGAKGDFVRSIRADERSAFKRAATRLHKEGFDWYIADNDLCFGVKPTDILRASPRGGRLWKSIKITINLSSRQFKAMTPALLARLKSSGGVEDIRGSRIRFSISQFDELVSDSDFLNEFADLCGVSGPRGLWPDQGRELAKDKKFEEKDDDRIPTDTVKMVLAQVRQNQGRFKALLKKVWDAKCAVSGCREESVLEGAHIIPYAVGLDYSKSNGLLLRADIHALFDARLLSVDADGRVHVAKSVKDTGYSSLQGKKLSLPKAKWPAKLADMLAERHAEYLEAHS